MCAGTIASAHLISDAPLEGGAAPKESRSHGQTVTSSSERAHKAVKRYIYAWGEGGPKATAG